MKETWAQYVETLEAMSVWFSHCNKCQWFSSDTLMIACPNNHSTHVDNESEHELRIMTAVWN